MIWLVGICGAMLFVSAILVLWRINEGPSTLDRMVGVDVMTSILLGGLALLVAATRRSDLMAVFVVVSVVGFLGSVSVARAARPDDPGKRRILTIEEERAIAAAEEAAEDEDEDSIAPVHPDGSEEDSDDYSS
ncbi:MAG: monovalent cation/H+ antiporter complex subunit F [Ancrocorticia sp.]